MILSLTPLYLPLVSRWHGSDHGPKVMKSIAYALPYGYACIDNLWHAGIALAGAAAFKSMGHEPFYRMATGQPAMRHTWLSRFLEALGNTRDTLPYCIAGMAWKGGLITLATNSDPLFLSSAIGYPLGYYLGRHHLKKKFGLDPTAWCEITAGFLASLGFLFV